MVDRGSLVLEQRGRILSMVLHTRQVRCLIAAIEYTLILDRFILDRCAARYSSETLECICYLPHLIANVDFD